MKKQSKYLKEIIQIFLNLFSKENQPIGTAGALINSYSKLKNEYSIVMNGDTYVNDNLKNLLMIIS